MKLLSFALFASIFILTGFYKDQSQASTKSKSTTLLRVIHIDKTLTSKEGCTVHIVGDLDVSFFPPRFNSFTGTVTLSGPGSCPHGTLTFSNVSRGADLLVTPDTDEICSLTTLTWFGSNSDFVNILNEEEINAALVDEIKTQSEC